MSRADRWHWSRDENGESLARIVPALDTPLHTQYIDEGCAKAIAGRAVNEKRGGPLGGLMGGIAREELWRD